MFKKFFKKINPTKIRTAEKSEFQDQLKDPKTRSPERDVFDKKTAEAAEKALHRPDETTEHSGANPNHE